jgi:hypothetical protein
MPHHLEGLVGHAGAHVKHVGVLGVAQHVGRGERRKEDRAFLDGDIRARVAAGGADEAEQHVGAVGQQLPGVGRSLGRVVAIVELAQLQLVAGVVLAGIERVDVKLRAGGESQPDLAGGAGERHRLAQDDLAYRALGLRPHVAHAQPGQPAGHGGSQDRPASRIDVHTRLLSTTQQLLCPDDTPRMAPPQSGTASAAG